MTELKQLSDKQREFLTIFKVHKIKKPKEYGGWSYLIYFTVPIPIIAFIFGIIGMKSDNEIKKVQGKALLIAFNRRVHSYTNFTLHLRESGT